MKEELIKMLIKAKADRAFYLDKYNGATFFRGKWRALIEQEDARIKEIEEQLSYF